MSGVRTVFFEVGLCWECGAEVRLRLECGAEVRLRLECGACAPRSLESGARKGSGARDDGREWLGVKKSVVLSRLLLALLVKSTLPEGESLQFEIAQKGKAEVRDCDGCGACAPGSLESGARKRGSG